MDESDRLIWIDLEMTGLDIDTDYIIEIACIVTDKDLKVIEIGPDVVIQQPKSILDQMDEWCIQHHAKSGLTREVLQSDISIHDAERMMLDFVKKHTKQGQCPLSGNSVHADKKFLEKFMPSLMKHFHYRIVDVSSIKELCRRWYPNEYSKAPQKKESHRALDDIKESITELLYYKQAVFKCI